MTNSTFIARPTVAPTGARRADDTRHTAGEARRARRRSAWKRPRGSLGGSPPGAGGRLLQL